MAQSTSNSILHRLVAWLKSSLGASPRVQADLELHRAMWLGRRNPTLEKTVRHYSY